MKTFDFSSRTWLWISTHAFSTGCGFWPDVPGGQNPGCVQWREGEGFRDNTITQSPVTPGLSPPLSQGPELTWASLCQDFHLTSEIQRKSTLGLGIRTIMVYKLWEKSLEDVGKGRKICQKEGGLLFLRKESRNEGREEDRRREGEKEIMGIS